MHLELGLLPQGGPGAARGPWQVGRVVQIQPTDQRLEGRVGQGGGAGEAQEVRLELP